MTLQQIAGRVAQRRRRGARARRARPPRPSPTRSRAPTPAPARRLGARADRLGERGSTWRPCVPGSRHARRTRRQGRPDALLLSDGAAFIVNVPKRTLVTPSRPASSANASVTQIDGAGFLSPANADPSCFLIRLNPRPARGRRSDRRRRRGSVHRHHDSFPPYRRHRPPRQPAPARRARQQHRRINTAGFSARACSSRTRSPSASRQAAVCRGYNSANISNVGNGVSVAAVRPGSGAGRADTQPPDRPRARQRPLLPGQLRPGRRAARGGAFSFDSEGFLVSPGACGYRARGHADGRQHGAFQDVPINPNVTAPPTRTNEIVVTGDLSAERELGGPSR